MGFVICKDCTKEFSTQAKKCPHCGVNKPNSGNAKALFYTLLLCGLIWAITIIVAPTEQKKKTNPMDYALGACRNFIKKGAHDPSSVEFDRMYPDPIQLQNGKYSITISFRAKNGFGALRHTNAECIMTYDNNSWRLEKLNQPN